MGGSSLDERFRGWRPIPGFAHYLLSETGEIYNTKNCKFLLGTQQNSKSRKVVLCPDGPGSRLAITVIALLSTVFPENYSDEEKIKAFKKGKTKLSIKEVLEIREKLKTGDPAKSLSIVYNVSELTIKDIALRKTWKNV